MLLNAANCIALAMCLHMDSKRLAIKWSYRPGTGSSDQRCSGIKIPVRQPGSPAQAGVSLFLFLFIFYANTQSGQLSNDDYLIRVFDIRQKDI